MSLRSRLAPALVVLGFGTLLALGAPLAASAHDQLESTDPAEGATVESLDAITLTFSGTLLSIGEDQRSAAIQVTSGDRFYEAGCPVLVDNTATTDVALGGAGTYDVLWQVVSSDGHTISGEYSFDYAPADGTEQSEGSATPLCGDSTAAADQPSDDAVLIGAAFTIGALAIIGVVVAIIFGRRRNAGGFGPPGQD
ncbi:copper resistance protein CopC [Amnibacterium flavum]|nr:copper resistance CopC family protein [Amnibacterium flavum]